MELSETQSPSSIQIHIEDEDPSAKGPATDGEDKEPKGPAAKCQCNCGSREFRQYKNIATNNNGELSSTSENSQSENGKYIMC